MPPLRIRILLSIFFLFPVWFSVAGPRYYSARQEPASSDSLKILNADMTRFDNQIAPDARRLIGNVIFNHDSVTMYCDSAWYYDKQRRIEAFGNIHIKRDFSTEELFGDFLIYDGNTRLAQIWNKVKATNGEATLTTNLLYYNVGEEVIYYNDGATIVKDSATLKSRQGRYFTRDGFAWFGGQVEVDDPEYTFSGDTLTYDNLSGTVEFFGPSRMTGKTGKDTLLSEAGWFDTRDSIAHFFQNVQVFNASGKLTTDTLRYNRKTDSGYTRGKTILTDTTHRIIASGEQSSFGRNPERVMLTDQALIKYWEKEDTLYLHADTIRSYTRIRPDWKKPVMEAPDSTIKQDSLVAQDSIAVLQKDSTFRELIAYRKVKFFRSDLQGAADSLYFATSDSTVRLFRKSVLWSGENQASSDSMKIFTLRQKPQRMEMYVRPLLVSREDALLFNQIKGLRITIFFNDSTQISKVDVKGKAESIYYPKDAEDIIGGNKTQSENLIILMENNQAETIRFYPATEGDLTPLEKIIPDQYNFPDFQWQDKQRPKKSGEVFLWVEPESLSAPRVLRAVAR